MENKIIDVITYNEMGIPNVITVSKDRLIPIDLFCVAEF